MIRRRLFRGSRFLGPIALSALAGTTTLSALAATMTLHDHTRDAGGFPISVAEARDAAEARFQELDADRSGEISPAELADGPRALRFLDRHDLHFAGPGMHRAMGLWLHGAGAGPAEADAHPEHGSPADLDEQLFTRLDADGDGLLARDEFSGSALRRARHEAMQARLFARLDEDSSGGLSRDELPDMSRRLEQLDTDGDGTVTAQEARSHHEAIREAHREARRAHRERRRELREGRPDGLDERS